MAHAPNRIVVAYDGSHDATLALNWGVQAAALLKLPVVAVVVGPRHHGPVPEGDWDATRLEEVRSAAGRALLDAGAADASAVVQWGRVPDTLLESAAGASLLVVGSAGHGQLGGALIGSVSQDLARRCTCPVVVVRPSQHPTSSRIVVGVDGSGGSAEALEFACRRAALTGEQVIALHAWRLSNVPVDKQGNIPTALVDRMADEERLVAEAVAGLGESYPDVDLRPDSIPVAAGQALVDASATASLVVVGSRGHGAVPGLLLGSVSQDVLQRARCPVAIVR